MTTLAPDRDLLTTREAAALVGVSVTTLRKLSRPGEVFAAARWCQPSAPGVVRFVRSRLVAIINGGGE